MKFVSLFGLFSFASLVTQITTDEVLSDAHTHLRLIRLLDNNADSAEVDKRELLDATPGTFVTISNAGGATQLNAPAGNANWLGTTTSLYSLYTKFNSAPNNGDTITPNQFAVVSLASSTALITTFGYNSMSPNQYLYACAANTVVYSSSSCGNAITVVSNQPSAVPTTAPSGPSFQPTRSPTRAPTFAPSGPSLLPTASPTKPTVAPTPIPTRLPTAAPSVLSVAPSNIPTVSLSLNPSSRPSSIPTQKETIYPADDDEFLVEAAEELPEDHDDEEESFSSTNAGVATAVVLSTVFVAGIAFFSKKIYDTYYGQETKKDADLQVPLL